MLPTLFLRQYVCRLTLFTRANCGLCDQAKAVLSNVWDKRPFEYDEVDVMTAGQQEWKDLYEFDTPVVHVDKTEENSPVFGTSAQARKLMHRFKEEQVHKLMDDAMMDAPSESPESPSSSSSSSS